jgi:hypothetical protein
MSALKGFALKYFITRQLREREMTRRYLASQTGPIHGMSNINKILKRLDFYVDTLEEQHV